MNTQPTRLLIDGRPARATGNHLVAAQDEPEYEPRSRLWTRDELAEARHSNQEHADFKTRAARAEIAKLAQYMDHPQVIALLSSLVNAFGQSMALRCVSGQSALESILDAVGVLEDAEAIDG
jgi:hypothetical protein